MWNSLFYPIIVLVVGGILLGFIVWLSKKSYLCWENHRERIIRIDENQEKLVDLVEGKLIKLVGTNFIVSNSVKDALIKGTNGNGVIYKASITEYEDKYKKTLEQLDFPYYKD